MKKITTLLLSLIIAVAVSADGWKPLSTLGSYNPDPTSGEVGNAFNFYLGGGALNGSNFGITIGADYEFPVIDPNLTLGPGVSVGIHQYGVPYIDANGMWHTGTGQFSFYGGIHAHYYFDWMIPSMPDEFDVFVTSNTGISFITYSNYYSNDLYFDWGTSVGGRWNFSESMSLYGQVGYGSSNILVGLSIKM